MEYKDIRAYRSCFIVDVQITRDKIQLLDSGRNKYFIDVADKAAFASFMSWFKTTFTKAQAERATVFQYEIRPDGEGSEIEEIYVKKFIFSQPAASREEKSLEEVQPESKDSKSVEA